MSTNPSRPIGFRKSQPFGDHSIGWRLWVGPLLVASTPGVGKRITIAWTR